jgi:hypothetical protein
MFCKQWASQQDVIPSLALSSASALNVAVEVESLVELPEAVPPSRSNL